MHVVANSNTEINNYRQPSTS